ALAVHVVSEPILAGLAIFIGGAFGWRKLRSGTPAESKEAVAPATERLPSLLPLPLLFASFGTLWALVQVFVPIGVMTFGGGLAMIPAIGRIVVDQQHWMGPKGFADAIALGQITPGPIAICATLIGYHVAGALGALVATAAMFGPAIVLAVVVGRSVDRFHGNPVVAGALAALAPIIIGMLLAATWSLGRAGVEGPLGAMVAVATFALLARAPRVSPLWPLVGGGLLQTVVTHFFHAAG
ncbi:MAG TPA: chromate transporter, partial [Ideonella sp.]|nr:chromate transporter [Ideonella sp.]